jgi:hypothetical protein
VKLAIDPDGLPARALERVVLGVWAAALLPIMPVRAAVVGAYRVYRWWTRP